MYQHQCSDPASLRSRIRARVPTNSYISPPGASWERTYVNANGGLFPTLPVRPGDRIATENSLRIVNRPLTALQRGIRFSRWGYFESKVRTTCCDFSVYRLKCMLFVPVIAL